jgi:hypothetical protein
MQFYDIYEMNKYSLWNISKVMKKPSINNYIKYLHLYYDKIVSFIEYHKQSVNTSNDLPLIDSKVLDELMYKLTNLDEMAEGIYYYSPYDIFTTYDEMKLHNTDRNTLKYVILGSSWQNFKIVLLWYIKLCKMGYDSGL